MFEASLPNPMLPCMEGTLLFQERGMRQVLKLTASQPVPLKQHLSASLEQGQPSAPPGPGAGHAGKPNHGQRLWDAPGLPCGPQQLQPAGLEQGLTMDIPASTAGLGAQGYFSASPQELKCWRSEISLCSRCCYLLLQFFPAHTLTLSKT